MAGQFGLHRPALEIKDEDPMVLSRHGQEATIPTPAHMNGIDRQGNGPDLLARDGRDNPEGAGALGTNDRQEPAAGVEGEVVPAGHGRDDLLGSSRDDVDNSNRPVAGAQSDPTAVGTEIEKPEGFWFQNRPAAAQVPDHAPAVPLIIAGCQESSVRAEFQEVGMMSRAGQDHQLLVVREPADAEVPSLIAPDISFKRLVEQEAIGPRRHRLPGFGESNIGQGQAGDGLIPQFEARSDSGGGGQFLEALEPLAGLAAEAMGPGPRQLTGGGGARLFQRADLPLPVAPYPD